MWFVLKQRTISFLLLKTISTDITFNKNGFSDILTSTSTFHFLIKLLAFYYNYYYFVSTTMQNLNYLSDNIRLKFSQYIFSFDFCAIKPYKI
jgi:hypothetical protein